MGSRWHALSILALVQGISSLNYFTLTALTPFIKSDFGLTASAIGFLTIAMYGGYFVGLIPGGLLTDQLGERVTLAGSTVLISISLFAVGFSPVYWLLIPGLFVLGFGYSPVSAGTNKGVSDWFPLGQRATALSIKQTGVVIGGAVGSALLPFIASQFNWRLGMLVAASLAVLELLLLFAYSPRHSITNSNMDADERSASEQLREVLRLAQRPRFNTLIVSGFFFGAAQFTLMAYILLYLTNGLLLAPVVSGLLYTLMQLSGAAMRIILGRIADSWFPNRKSRLLSGLGIVGCFTYVPAILLTPSNSLTLVTMTVIAVGGIALGYNGVYLTVATDLTDPERTGSATSVAVASLIVGAIVTPPVFGYLVDITDGFSASLTLLGVLTLIAGLFSSRIGSFDPNYVNSISK